MPATTDLSPAEQAIADARSERDSFLERANDIFEGAAQARTAALNPMTDALSAAALKSSGVNPPPEAGAQSSATSPHTKHSPATKADSPSAPADTAPKSATAIPGPPKAQPSVSTDAAKPSDGATTASPQSGTADSTDDDIPAADAFDKGSNRPKTNDWRKLHAKKDQLLQQLEVARKEAEELRARAAGAGQDKTVPPPEFQQQLAAIQKERDQLVQVLESVAVEKSPRFEQMFKPRLEAALNQAKMAVGVDKAEKIVSLLQQPESQYRDEQIEAIVGELRPLQQQKLLNSIAELDRISGERAAMTSQGSQLWKQWQQESQAQAMRQTEERQKQVQSTFDTVLSEWKQAGADLDEQGVSIARDVFSGNRDLRDIANAAMWVAVGPRAAATAQKLQAENQRLEAELAKLRQVQPGVARDTRGAPQVSDELPTNVGYAEGIIQAALRAGLPLR